MNIKISELKDVLDHSYLNCYTEDIVRAVNAHEELLEAAKRALEYADLKYVYAVQLKQAIAKAEGR